MNNYNSKLKFKEITEYSHYLRVDDKHPLELLVGLNDYGQKTLRFTGDFKKIQVKDTKSISVNHYKVKDKLAITFSLSDNEFVDLFYIFCNDIIDVSRNINQLDGYTFIVNRYEKWRGFANASRKFLSEIEIRGLIGELLFLKNELFNKYGVIKSVSGWTGPEPTKKDFSYDDVWYEVKTVNKDKVIISSLEQLDSDNIGYLILYYLEKLSPEAREITVNNIVDEIMVLIEHEIVKSQFIMKLVQLGYYREDYYDQFVYRCSKLEIYEVGEDFPNLNRNNLPSAVSNVKYELIISMIEKYKKDRL